MLPARNLDQGRAVLFGGIAVTVMGRHGWAGVDGMNDAPGAGVAGAGTQALSDRSAHANEITVSALDQRGRLPGAVIFSIARIAALPSCSTPTGATGFLVRGTGTVIPYPVPRTRRRSSGVEVDAEGVHRMRFG